MCAAAARMGEHTAPRWVGRLPILSWLAGECIPRRTKRRFEYTKTTARQERG